MNDIRGSFEITLPLEDFQDDNAKDIRGNIDKVSSNIYCTLQVVLS